MDNIITKSTYSILLWDSEFAKVWTLNDNKIFFEWYHRSIVSIIGRD